jgi:calmodulin
MSSLTKDQIDECKSAFKHFDQDKDGSISSKEIGQLMTAIGVKLSPKELEDTIKEYDTNKSGKIDYDEFLALFEKKINEPDSKEDIIEAFKIFDNRNDGTIAVDDLKDVITAFGNPLTDEEFNFLLIEAEVTTDNRINYKNFVERSFA